MKMVLAQSTLYVSAVAVPFALCALVHVLQYLVERLAILSYSLTHLFH